MAETKTTKLGLDLSSKRRRTREDYFYFLTYRLRWADNDMFGHVNNPYYGGLVDSIVNQYLVDECGYKIGAEATLAAASAKSNPSGAGGTTADSTADPGTLSAAGIVANTYCDYFESLNYPDVIDVGLRVVKLGKTSVTYEVGFFRRGNSSNDSNDSNTVKAVGGSTHIWVERSYGGIMGRPLKNGMPDVIRKGYLRLMAPEEGGTASVGKGQKQKREPKL